MQISQDELERLQTAVKDEQFKKLFLDYVNELQDPQNRETYEREISAMEREKGINTRWIHPTPVFVVKTHVLESASRKMFINVCSCPDIEEASARSEGKGQHWSLPHILSAAGHRMDKDKSGKECLVQDIVFHPNTIQKLRKTPVYGPRSSYRYIIMYSLVYRVFWQRLPSKQLKNSLVLKLVEVC